MSLLLKLLVEWNVSEGGFPRVLAYTYGNSTASKLFFKFFSYVLINTFP